MHLSAIDVLNYSVRISIIAIGILFLSGKAMMVPGDPSFTLWIGTAFVVFGGYRTVLYYFKTRQSREDEDENDNKVEN